jgi:hypothetical protein
MLRSRPVDTPLPLFRPEASTTFARSRDAAILSLLDIHPVTASLLVGLELFPSKKKAQERLRRLQWKRHVLLVGTVAGRSGGAENVYCRWRPMANHLLHELDLTRVCLKLSAGCIFRGPEIKDRVIRPDAEVWINERLFYLELDRGTMRLGQIDRRFARYESFPELSLWVCPDEPRKEMLRGRAERIRHSALFTTFAEAVTDPHATIWMDFAGGTAALPRQR